MDSAQLRFLQTLIATPGDRRISTVATDCCAEHRIGMRVGQKYVYDTLDIENACALLQSHKLPISASTIVDRADAAIRPGISEKYGTAAPHQDSVAYRLFKGQQAIGTGYAVATAAEVGTLPGDVLLVVENFETFRQLHRYQWVLGSLEQFSQTVVVFRGDMTYPISDAYRCIHASELPKIGFHDFDPAGLAMSCNLPGLIEHLLPPLEVLQKIVVRSNRSDLYFAQLSQYTGTLDKSTVANIPAAWKCMKQLQRGLPQEWMRDL